MEVSKKRHIAKTSKALMIDAYRENRMTGSVILVDEQTHETVAAGMIV